MKDINLNTHLGIDAESKSKVAGFNITRRHLSYASFIIICLIGAVILARLPLAYQLVMLAAIPAILIVAIILKDPIYGIYLFFFIDYLRPQDFIPALIPLRLSMVIEILTLISWLLYIKEKKIVLKWSKLNYLYICFIALIALSVLPSVNQRFVFNLTQLFIINFIMYLVATNRIDSIKRLDVLILFLLLIFAYLSIKGIMNFASGKYAYGNKITTGTVGSSFLADENDFALALNFMIPFAYFYFMEKFKGIKKHLSLGILILLVLGVIASGSRGGWIGLIVALIYCLLMSRRKGLSLVITGLLAISIALFAPAKYWQGVSSIFRTEEGTAQSRILYWKAGLRMFYDHPIIGVGAWNGPIRMPEYITGYSDARTQWGREFHGTFPEIMAELGATGLILFLAMLFFAAKQLRKILKTDLGEDRDGAKPIARAILGSMLAYLVTATFLSAAYYPELWTLYAFTTILMFTAKPNDNQVQLTVASADESSLGYPINIR